MNTRTVRVLEQCQARVGFGRFKMSSRQCKRKAITTAPMIDDKTQQWVESRACQDHTFRALRYRLGM